MTTHRDLNAIIEAIGSLHRLAISELAELRETVTAQQRLATNIKQAANAVVAATTGSDAEFRRAVSLLVTAVLGPMHDAPADKPALLPLGDDSF